MTKAYTPSRPANQSNAAGPNPMPMPNPMPKPAPVKTSAKGKKPGTKTRRA